MSSHPDALGSVRAFIVDEDKNFFSYEIVKSEADVIHFTSVSEANFTVDLSGGKVVFSSDADEFADPVEGVNAFIDENPGKPLADYLEQLADGQAAADDDGEGDDLDELGSPDAFGEEGEGEMEGLTIESDDDEMFAQPAAVVTAKKKEDDDEIDFDTLHKTEQQFGVTTTLATNRLIREYLHWSEAGQKKSDDLGIWTLPYGDDNLFKWKVKMYNFDAKVDAIAGDLAKLKKQTGSDHIELEMTFPEDYPFAPPFIRVIKPRMMFRTGRVTVGGSLCMEFLTKTRWQSVYTIEATLIVVRNAMLEDGKEGPRIDFASLSKEYSEHEAKSAFLRVAQFHGWKT